MEKQITYTDEKLMAKVHKKLACGRLLTDKEVDQVLAMTTKAMGI